jgi:hypothetical protein
VVSGGGRQLQERAANDLTFASRVISERVSCSSIALVKESSGHWVLMRLASAGVLDLRSPRDGPIFRPLTPGLIVPNRRAIIRTYGKLVLKRLLSQNEIYAAVDAAVPKHFAPYDREDIIAQTVVEILEDGLGLEMVKTVAREVINDHFDRSRVSIKVKSLDEPIFFDSTTSIIGSFQMAGADLFGEMVTNGGPPMRFVQLSDDGMATCLLIDHGGILRSRLSTSPI